MSDKQIQDWQEKVRSSYGDESKLFEYLFTTMDNFYFRYMETTINKNLKTQLIKDHIWGAKSFESSMIDALKITNPMAKKGSIDLAKSVPKGQGVMVCYELLAEVKHLSSEQGEIQFMGKIDWGFPDYSEENKRVQKRVTFIYNDLTRFRKELALKLEEVCEIFL
jgi:hypothetical protein